MAGWPGAPDQPGNWLLRLQFLTSTVYYNRRRFTWVMYLFVMEEVAQTGRHCRLRGSRVGEFVLGLHAMMNDIAVAHGIATVLSAEG